MLTYRKYVYPAWLSLFQDLLAEYPQEPSQFNIKVKDIIKDLSSFDLEQVQNIYLTARS